MAHITKPMKEKAEYTSFGYIVVHECSLIDKNWRNTEMKTEQGIGQFPSRPRVAFKK
jgi:hypothetical protein